ncbi:PaaI family thioesterase [Falsirhodobacter sp. alg1]|uniref:PaaI family thioesterase n=1 Tax=Falsirhodobacter sp. alg1 TaxID=1472418 RepID=UPI0005EDD4F8|nr:PaaI family thioesterase [Falsirhodobacter sp. alg1]
MMYEPVEVIRARRDAALADLVRSVPYLNVLGIKFDRRGDELTAILPFAPSLIGVPTPPAIHGGATAAFLESAALIELAWSSSWARIEAGEEMPRLPRTINLTVDYLRPGLPRDAYARARINRFGRRYASVHVEAWQDNRARLFAQATGHFLMPEGA